VHVHTLQVHVTFLGLRWPHIPLALSGLRTLPFVRWTTAKPSPNRFFWLRFSQL
jgi:hypothetical protein